MTGPTTDTRFLYDGDQLALEYDANGAISWRYFFGPNVDEPIVADAGGRLDCDNTRFLHLNAITVTVTEIGSDLTGLRQAAALPASLTTPTPT